jgi:hypothetical protein
LLGGFLPAFRPLLATLAAAFHAHTALFAHGSPRFQPLALSLQARARYRMPGLYEGCPTLLLSFPLALHALALKLHPLPAPLRGFRPAFLLFGALRLPFRPRFGIRGRRLRRLPKRRQA